MLKTAKIDGEMGIRPTTSSFCKPKIAHIATQHFFKLPSLPATYPLSIQFNFQDCTSFV